jgi:hypothetical protein
VSGPQFLPGIPASHVLARLAKAGGKEVESGKLLIPESSAALAVNCFGWFIERPETLPTNRGHSPEQLRAAISIQASACHRQA